jgi:hypothetical protein
MEVLPKINSKVCCQQNHTLTRWLSLITISFIFFLITLYIIITRGKQYILDNWVEYRNNPFIIPFAGIIKGDNSASNHNFTDYVVSIIEKIVKIMLKPVLFIFKLIIKSIKDVVKTLNNFRNFANKLRNNVLTYFNGLETRIKDVVGTLQFTLLKFFNILGKASGMLTISKYLLLVVALSLKTIVGVIGEVVKTIVTIACVLSGMLMLIGGPVVWAVLGSLEYLSNGVGIKTCCFDENTSVKLKNGKYKLIKDIIHSDILFNNINIIGIIKTLSYKENIYNYKGIIVTGDHTIFEEKKWIRVSNSRYSIKIDNYQKKYLYCLITNNNIIPINNLLFGDYCEISNKKEITTINNYILHFLNKSNQKYKTNCSRYYDGLVGNTQILMDDGLYKNISEIKIKDKIKGGIVTGIITIFSENDNLYNLNGNIMTGGIPLMINGVWKKCCDIRSKPFSIADNVILYNILTSSGFIYLVNEIKITDFGEVQEVDILENIDNFVLKKKNELHSC